MTAPLPSESKTTPLLVVTFVFAGMVTLAGAVFAPQHVWPNVLVAGYFLAGLGLSGGFIVAVHDTSGGRWLGSMRAIASTMTRLVLPGVALVLAAVTIGGTYLYPAFSGAHAEGFRGFWLDRGFFTARAFAYAAIWLAALAFLRRRRGAALYLVLYGVTVSLATFDWIMALEAHWASTILAVYHFAGMLTGALCVLAITAVARSRTETSITTDHLHDVAKLLFAFSTFWMYIWFSQAMLIWYSNLPEETGWYLRRAYGNWGVLFWAVVGIQWVLPFLALMSARTKRNRTILLRIAVAVLIGHFLDLYVSIVAAGQAEPALTGWELAIALGAFAIVGWTITRRETPSIDALPDPRWVPPPPKTAAQY